MKKSETSIDPLEVAKFASLTSEWWKKDGAFKTLHDVNPQRIEFILNHCALAGLRVLDVGCGGGILAEGLARCDAQVTGLDVESAAIEEAKRHAGEQGLNINYHCQAIENYQDNAFDCITCMEMLEHVQDPGLVIKHCARLLKPNGYLFLSTIDRSPQAYLALIIAAEYLLGLLPRQTHDYKKFIRPSELATIVRASGLTVIGLSGLAYHPFLRRATLQSSVNMNYLMVCQNV